MRAIRRRFRSVRYHAASRPDTAWHRWRDRLLLLAIPASLPLVLVVESSWHRTFVAAEVRGGLVGRFGGPYQVGVAPDADSPINWPPGAQQAQFRLQAMDRLDGWPLTTRVTRGIVRLDATFFAETTDRDDIRPDASSPLGSSIITGLSAPEVAENLPAPIPGVIARWDRDGGLPGPISISRYWPGTIAAVASAWLGLSLAAVIGVALARYTWRITAETRNLRKTHKSSRGLCASCGFDLRGNLFTERCPECGALSE
jgi:hypothetical protein